MFVNCMCTSKSCRKQGVLSCMPHLGHLVICVWYTCLIGQKLGVVTWLTWVLPKEYTVHLFMGQHFKVFHKACAWWKYKTDKWQSITPSSKLYGSRTLTMTPFALHWFWSQVFSYRSLICFSIFTVYGSQKDNYSRDAPDHLFEMRFFISRQTKRLALMDESEMNASLSFLRWDDCFIHRIFFTSS